MFTSEVASREAELRSAPGPEEGPSTRRGGRRVRAVGSQAAPMGVSALRVEPSDQETGVASREQVPERLPRGAVI